MRNTGPKTRLARRIGEPLRDKDSKYLVKRNYPPGMHGQSRRRLSELGVQLQEKQKAKWIYGLAERQFRRLVEKAMTKKGRTGDLLLASLELRLDNVVYRALFVPSRAEARQLINHGLIVVNGRTVNIPSFQVRAGDTIQLRQDEALQKRVQSNLEMLKDRPFPAWLELNHETVELKILRLPEKADAGLPLEESQIVELYSK